MGKNHHSTLPETNSSPLKMDGWNTIVSFWDGLFSGAMLVSGRVSHCFAPYELTKGKWHGIELFGVAQVSPSENKEASNQFLVDFGVLTTGRLEI